MCVEDHFYNVKVDYFSYFDDDLSSTFDDLRDGVVHTDAHSVTISNFPGLIPSNVQKFTFFCLWYRCLYYGIVFDFCYTNGLDTYLGIKATF